MLPDSLKPCTRAGHSAQLQCHMDAFWSCDDEHILWRIIQQPPLNWWQSATNTRYLWMMMFTTPAVGYAAVRVLCPCGVAEASNIHLPLIIAGKRALHSNGRRNLVGNSPPFVFLDSFYHTVIKNTPPPQSFKHPVRNKAWS